MRGILTRSEHESRLTIPPAPLRIKFCLLEALVIGIACALLSRRLLHHDWVTIVASAAFYGMIGVLLSMLVDLESTTVRIRGDQLEICRRSVRPRRLRASIL